ncbi:universal stress protein [Desulfotomaculum copahuensis]|nr:universal stress protein [Desulfotomaculum copahuensis]
MRNGIKKTGRLKILLGVARGAGKTSRLLEEGTEMSRSGTDVVVGVAQCGEEETARPECRLERLPLPDTASGEAELDVAAVIKRRPQVVLIDDLAHRAALDGQLYRWQQVERILDEGIDVLATVDVEQLEGMQPLIKEITGKRVEEVVPDAFVRRADELELIDVTEEELAEREAPAPFERRHNLGRAVRQYLASTNFAALRQIALHQMADQVDEWLELYRARRGLLAPSGVREHILVSVHSPFNLERLLRAGVNLAHGLQGSLMVVQLHAPVYHRGEEVTRLPREYIEAVTKPVNGVFIEVELDEEKEVPDKLAEIIREKKITRLVVGHSARSRWEEFWRGSVLSAILHRNRHIDVLVVANRRAFSGKPAGEKPAHKPGGTEALPVCARNLPGRLKVYLGMAAGVGKTYRMLVDGNELLEKGLDVVAGYIETHGRDETCAQIGALEVLPRREVVYRGRNFDELDLDAVLKRRPQLVLIDELAHTNIPGVKNAKRYQDVLEIMRAGIDVYTTLNVQHLESLNDVVEEATGVKVRETVPDWVLDLAREVVLVDLAPSALLLRLEEGKVYPPGKAEQAMANFFQPANLTALRELALRRVAGHLDRQVEKNKHTVSYDGNILVAVNLRPAAERLIRRGFRLAYGLKSNLFVAYFNTGQMRSPAEERVYTYIKTLCQTMGVSFLERQVGRDRDVAVALLMLARELDSRQLFLGHSERNGWQKLLRGSIIDSLLREARDLDLHLIAPPRGEVPRPVRL